MRDVRLSPALVIAVCAHAAVALALGLAPKAPSSSSLDGPAGAELDVEVSADPVSTAAAEQGEPGLDPAAAAMTLRPTRGVAARAATGAAAPAASSTERGALPPPETGREPWVFGGAPMDLDVNSYRTRVATSGSIAQPPPADSLANARASTILREGLQEHDRDVGLGSAGPLISAAHEAASGANAPDTGTVTLEIDSDAAGTVVAARIVAADDAAAWTRVARDLVRAMSAKRVRVPPGARGTRTRLRIVVERAPPSGKKTATHAGAVPDDVPGSEGACSGTGASRRCVAGMPAGASWTGADVANAVGKASRIVRVVALGEETL